MRLRLPAPTNNKIGSGSGAALKVAAPAPQLWTILREIKYVTLKLLFSAYDILFVLKRDSGSRPNFDQLWVTGTLRVTADAEQISVR